MVAPSMLSFDVENPLLVAGMRLLAKKEEVKLDYTIMAVMVFTLGLILVVELGRHYIDHKAETHPFVQSVLVSVYSELSTLGIVEAAVYVLLSYYDGLNMDQKKVFEYCHFLLFFTAIFNALMSCIQAWIAFRVSNRLWVRTEQLELSHYVVIREEFEDLEEKVQALKPPSLTSNSIWSRVGRVAARLYAEITNPITFRRYRRLLVQVRFHELRLHFLQANDLPLTLRVSDYLASSNLAVLKSLVSVSAFAWILLTSASNITYFLLGMLVHITDDGGSSVTKAMAYLFVGGNALAVTIAIVLFYKMKHIFYNIMKMKFIDCAVTTERLDQDHYDSTKEQQLSMFWGANPAYVVGVIQFMQFGFAISAGILLIFWEKVDKYGFIPATDYLVSILVSYTIFAMVLGEVIPRYAMCISLGALVDRKRLKEVTAKYKLEEVMLMANSPSGSKTDTIDEDGTSVSHSEESSLHSKLTNIAELVQTKTSDLRSTRSIRNLGNLDDLATADSLRSQRRHRRKKSYSDSRSIAMMQHYGGNLGKKETITEGIVTRGGVSDDDSVSILKSTSYLSLASLGASSDQGQPETSLRSVKFQIEGSPDDVSQETTPLEVSVPVEVNGKSTEEAEDVTFVDVVEEPPTFTERFLDYIETAGYRLISFVFGTMACFYFVGMRVEGLLLSNGEFKDFNATFQLPLGAAFWLETGWLLAMLSVSLFLFKVAGPERRKIRLACCIDAFILLLCLGLLMGSEAARCCDDVDCCGQLGTRTNGGIGNIEPFTSLVALRFLRFYVAKKILKHYNQELSSKKKLPGGHGHGHGSDMLHERGNIIDLWQYAVSKYPEIVQKEGEFSGALLMAMLGINVDNLKHGTGVSNSTFTPRSMAKAKPLAFVGEEQGVSLLSPGDMQDQSKLDAKLILPMRRCDWMLQPLISQWRSVDVVVTENEIVVLQALDVEAENNGSVKNMKELVKFRKIINKTMGGSGMKLRDVIVGRKILGRIDMELIDALTVERLPRERLPSPYPNDEDDDGEDFLGNEFWAESGVSPGSGKQARLDRWNSVCEDQLKIHTADTTTYLRFYTDLEAKTKDDSLSVSLVQSFQWCRTIANIRGAVNLDQNLPHFGEENDGEFLDYLHVTSRASGGAEHHGRATTFKGLTKHLHISPHHGKTNNGLTRGILQRKSSTTDCPEVATPRFVLHRKSSNPDSTTEGFSRAMLQRKSSNGENV